MKLNTMKGQLWAIRKTAECHNPWTPWNIGAPAYERGFAPLVNRGDIVIEFEGEGDIFLVVVSPSPLLKEAGISFNPIRLWVQKNESFPILRGLRKKSLRTGKMK